MNAAIVTYTIRACLPARRRLAVTFTAAFAALFGLLAKVEHDGTVDYAFADVASNGIFALVVPIACLLVGDAVLGSEVRSGTLPFTWLSPVPFWRIVAGRWLAGWSAAAVVLVPFCVLGAFIAGAGAMAWPMAVAAAASAAAYVAVFIAIGCLARRAAVWSLAFVFLVERLLAGALSGIAQLSPSWLGRETFLGLADFDQGLAREGVPSGWGGVVRLAIVTVVALALASWRLARVPLARSD